MTTKIFWNIAVFLLVTLCPVFCAVAAVRDAPANRPPAVRDAITGPLRDDSSITLSNVTDQVTSGPDLEPVTIIATATSQPDVPIPQPVPTSRPVSVPNRTQRPNSLSDIGHQFSGGWQLIRDSAGALVGLGVDTAVEGVANVVRPVVQGVAFVVRPVVQVAENVVNKTVFIGSNIANAGHQIAGAWGNSLQQTRNITGQLVNNVVGRR